MSSSKMKEHVSCPVIADWIPVDEVEIITREGPPPDKVRWICCCEEGREHVGFIHRRTPR